MTTSTTPVRIDVYSRVTSKILADLENGVRTWQRPWNAIHSAGRVILPLRHNGTPYRGVNVLMLWNEAMVKGSNSPIWMTYKQASEIGAQVRKGEHGSLVVYADKFTKKDTNDQGAVVVSGRDSLHEGLHSLQCRTGRRLAGAVRGQAPGVPRPHSSH